MKYFITLFLSVLVLTSCSSLESNSLAQDAKDSNFMYAYRIDTSDKIYRVIGFGQTCSDGSFIIHDINDKVWTFPLNVVVKKQPVTYEFYLNRTKIKQ